MERMKQYAVIGVFFLLICGFSVTHFLLPDKDFSPEERKTLTQAPTLTWDAIRTGDYFADAEAYLLDQFPLRPQFLNTKRILDKNIFLMDSSSGYASVGDHLTQLTPTLHEDQAEHAVKLFNKIINSHPELNQVYYSIIPDKNYFLSQLNNQPSLDYDKLFQITEGIQGEKIDITHLLSLDDFYYTDSHWRQERIIPVAEALCHAMGVSPADSGSYHATTLDGFKGIYYTLTESPPEPEQLIYLRNDAIDHAEVKRLNNSLKIEKMEMYTPENIDKEFADPYDVYLDGPESMITIENPNATSSKHLIMIRDSFGSALAPLLVDSYTKITILDLRYLKSAYFSTAGVDFTDADVLFLCSTTMMNNAKALSLY